jgi:hypothetical protein
VSGSTLDARDGSSRPEAATVRSESGTAARSGPPSWVVGLAGLAIAVAAALRILVPHDFDPTIFVTFAKDDSPIQIAYPGRLLEDVNEGQGFSHDGKFFFAQANDPWYLHPEEHAVVLDQPIYRGERMLYPLVAGGFGLFSPDIVVWSMLITNIFAMAVGSLLTAKVAEGEALSTWLGVSFPLNFGLLFELSFGGSGILAYACCVAGVFALRRERAWLAASAFAGAALSREVMIIFALGIFTLRWIEEREATWRLLTVPIVAMACWDGYLVARLGEMSGAGGGPEKFSAPFLGIIEAFPVWTTDAGHLIVDILIVCIIVLFVPVALRSRSPLAWGALPFVLLAPFLSANVWLGMFNFTRALAPIFTAVPFLVVSSRRTQVEARAFVGGPGDPVSRMRGDIDPLTGRSRRGCS